MAGPVVARIALSRFRSYKSVRLQPDAGPLAIFGANGAGKTNLLEAVSFLSPGRGIRRAGAEQIARTPDSVGWKVNAVIEGLGTGHVIETSAAPDTPRQVRIDDKTTTQVALGKVARIVWLVPSMDRLWLEGADGRRRFLDRLTLSFFPAHAEASLNYEKAMRERNRLLRDGVRDDAWYRALEWRMAEAGAIISANRLAALDRIRQAQERAETAFPAAELALESRDGLDSSVAEDELGARLSQNRAQDLAAGRTLIGPHRADLAAVYQDKGVVAKLCSTGEQKALLISLVLANARALASEFDAPPIILLDEIAAHLDTDRRAALFDEICALGAQAWMTGTEAGLFEALKRRAQFFEVAESADGSTVSERTQ